MAQITPSGSTQSQPERPGPERPDPADAPPSRVEADPLEGGQGGFLDATLGELRKVVWPSRQQLFAESVAVILMVTLSAFAIAAIDRLYSWANAQVFR